MEESRAAARRTLARAGPLFLSRLLGRGLAALKGILLARALGPAGYGLLSAAAAAVGTAAPLFHSALDTASVREVARAPAGARLFLRRVLGAKLLLGLFFAGLLPWLGLAPPLTTALVALDSLFVAVGGVGIAWLAGREEASKVAGAELLRSLLWVVAAAATFLNGWGTGGAAGAQALASLAATALLLAGSRLLLAPSFAGLPSLFRAARPFYVSVLFTTVYLQADRLLLALLGSEEMLGHYAAAANLVASAAMVGGALSVATLPALFREREGGRGIVSYRVRAGLLGALPAVALLILLRDPIVRLLFGTGFRASALPLAILAPCLPLRLLAGAWGDFLTATDRQPLRNRAQALAALANVSANALLIPRYGAAGAAAAFLLSDALLAGAVHFLSKRRKGAAGD
jgi:O-antigen/teichoic acid export membrane protein